MTHKDRTEELIEELKGCGTVERTCRNHNVGTSDYSQHKIQPWDIWMEYKLNPFDADIVKRILRNKYEKGKTLGESRIQDYEKIIHICQERIDQIKTQTGPWCYPDLEICYVD